MKALTVQQPWAWAIVHGGKDVENRTQAWSYRGPLLVHSGMADDTDGYYDENIKAALAEVDDSWTLEEQMEPGAILGVVDLVDVHPCKPGCCRSLWAAREPVVVTWTGPLGQTRSRTRVHLELANPRPLATPVPCRGRLGLWTPDTEVLDQVAAQLTTALPDAAPEYSAFDVHGARLPDEDGAFTVNLTDGAP